MIERCELRVKSFTIRSPRSGGGTAAVNVVGVSLSMPLERESAHSRSVLTGRASRTHRRGPDLPRAESLSIDTRRSDGKHCYGGDFLRQHAFSPRLSFLNAAHKLARALALKVHWTGEEPEDARRPSLGKRCVSLITDGPDRTDSRAQHSPRATSIAMRYVVSVHPNWNPRDGKPRPIAFKCLKLHRDCI